MRTRERDHRQGEAESLGLRFTAPLITGTALNPINSSLIATAMVGIGADFHRGPGQTAVLISVLYLCSAVAQPTLGKLGPVLGERRVFIAGAVTVLVAGIVGAAAWSFPMLVLSRALLGIGTSAAYPTSMSLIRSRADALGRGVPRSVLGVFAIVGQVISLIGLPVGGVLTGVFGWRAVFAINIPIALITVVLVLRGIPKDAAAAPRDPRRILLSADPVGIALFAAATVTALEFLRAPTIGTAGLAAVAIAAVGALALWELRAPEPLLDLRMLAGNAPLVITYLRQAIAALGMYTTMYGISQWMEDAAGYGPAQVGLLLIPMSATSIVVARINSRRGGVRSPLLGAGASFAAAGVVMVLMHHDSAVWVLIVMSLLVGLANGLSGFANQAALYVQAPSNQVGVASGLYRTFAYLGAISSASLIGAAFGDRADDAGLHMVAWVTVGIGIGITVLAAADRSLPRKV